MTTRQTEKRNAKRPGIEEITLPVSGMTCAACVRKVEKTLRGLPGVEEANVNLSAGKAGVVYDPERTDLPQMERAITDIGYEVPLARLDLLVLGMTPGHCDLIIDKALRALPGVRDVVVNCATDTVRVDYLDVAVSRRRRSRRPFASSATKSRRRAKVRQARTASASCAGWRSGASA